MKSNKMRSRGQAQRGGLGSAGLRGRVPFKGTSEKPALEGSQIPVPCSKQSQGTGPAVHPGHQASSDCPSLACTLIENCLYTQFRCLRNFCRAEIKQAYFH